MGIFEDEKLNNLFEREIGKKEFSREDLNKISKTIKISSSSLSQELSQSDMNKLLELKNLSFSDIDFRDLELVGNDKFYKLDFENCNLEDCTMSNIRTKELVLKKCNLKEDFLHDFEALDEIEKFEVVGRQELDVAKVYKDYPDYDDMSLFDRIDIDMDEKYQSNEWLNLSGLSELKNLKVLNVSSIRLSDDFAESLTDMDNLSELNILSTNIDKELIFPSLRNLKNMRVENIENINSIKNIRSLEILSITGDKNTENKEALKNFENLISLTVKGIDEADKYIASKETLRTLNLDKCGIKDIAQFGEYSSLLNLRLDSNEISENRIEDIIKLVKSTKIEKITFDKTEASKKAEQIIFEIKNPIVAEKYKKIFRDTKGISLKELLRLGKQIKIESVEELKALKESGILDVIDVEKKEINIGSFEGLTEEQVDFLAQNCKKIKLSSFRGMSEELLQKFEGCKFAIQGDMLARGQEGSEQVGDKEPYYTRDEVQEIFEYIDLIVSNIPEGADDLTKFLSICADMSDYIDYDNSGSMSSNEYIEGNEDYTRSYKGVLVNGNAVCMGYSLALNGVLDYAGITSRVIDGFAYGNPNSGHAWNQVKIDGKTYNTDLTWDCPKYRAGIDLAYCLRGDDFFYKDHTPGNRNTDIEKCTEDYDREAIKQTLENIKIKKREKSNNSRNVNTELKSSVADREVEKQFSIKDFEECAKIQEIEPSKAILQDLREIANKDVKSEIISEKSEAKGR